MCQCLSNVKDQDKDADVNVDTDDVRTEYMDIDFRVCVIATCSCEKKSSKTLRVREFVKIESHLHRRALQAELKQNDAYNPFSKESKVIIRGMGDVELFELCETIPKVQCSECHLHWNQRGICCFCGHFLKESEASQNFL